MEKTKFTIVGMGNGGHVLAGHLGIMGYEVRAYDIKPDVIEAIKKRGGVELSEDSVVKGFGKVKLATTNVKEAVEGADVMMVVTPASAHRAVATDLATCVEDGQIIVLNPGRTFGALEVRSILDSKGVSDKVIVSEAQTLIYLARKVGPAMGRMISLKKEGSVPLAALPAKETDRVLKVLIEALPTYGRANNVLDTSLNNFGAIVHTAPLVFSAGWAESKQPYKWYWGAISPSVGDVLEVIDGERMDVSQAVGADTYSLQDYIFHAYGVRGKTAYEACQSNKAYGDVMGPNTLQHRFMFEDIPTGLVPFASLGDLLGVPTPNIKLIIQVASLLVKTDLWRMGRTVQKLGLARLSAKEIKKFVTNGEL